MANKQKHRITVEGTMAGTFTHRDKITLGSVRLPDNGTNPTFGTYRVTIFSPWIRDAVSGYRNGEKIRMTGYFYVDKFTDEVEFRLTRLLTKKKSNA